MRKHLFKMEAIDFNFTDSKPILSVTHWRDYGKNGAGTSDFKDFLFSPSQSMTAELVLLNSQFPKK